MMGEVVVLIIIGFLLIRLVVAMVNAFSLLYLPQSTPVESQLVSVLIPARNEAANLPVLLEELVNQQYSKIEVLVYDDESEDNTASIVELYEKRDSRVRLLRSESLPDGWLGKNFACHNLAKQAKGDYLLFLDADVKITLDLIGNAVGYVHEKKLDLLSIFPTQKMQTRGEWLTVPLMNWILLSLLPLPMVRISKNPSLAAANGQFMMFRSSAYKGYNWHEQVKNNLVEDIVIIRKMKSRDFKAATLLGNNDIVCRMYNSYEQAMQGFSKNVIEFFGGSYLFSGIYTLLVFGGIAIPFIAGIPVFIVYLILVIFLRVFISLASRQSVTNNLLYHFPQMITFMKLILRGMKVRKTGKYSWKGRETK
jgi:glycosyltransferase involved in cell wall biosynthesis